MAYLHFRRPPGVELPGLLRAAATTLGNPGLMAGTLTRPPSLFVSPKQLQRTWTRYTVPAFSPSATQHARVFLS
jgi:hypothetical protein